MEPVAPGTEEDLQHLPVVSKKTSEEERLLSIRAYLAKGEYGPVFELSYRNGAQHWYCKVCRCPIMGRVFYHESGRRHSLSMEQNRNRFDPQDGKPPEEKVAPVETSTIMVAPGEPVPPGFEGEVTKVAQIQERLNSFTSNSLLGLEYLLEIQDYDRDKEPSYLCLLCWKKGDPRTVIAHLVSYNHLQGYLRRHFPKTYQALAPYITRQFKKNWQDAMNKIVEAIETKYGRLLPHPVDAETFESKKDQIYMMVHTGPHFSEKNGITFEDLVKKEDMTKINEVVEDDATDATDVKEPVKKITKKRSPSPPVVSKPKKPKPSTVTANRRRSLSSVSSISSSELSDFDVKKGSKPTIKNKVPQRSKPPFVRNRQSRSRSPRPRKHTKRSPSPRRSRRDGDMPWNRPDYGRSRSKDRRSKSEIREEMREEKMLNFKRLSEAIENDMGKTLKQHKQNPEKHPQYNDEWKIFWNKRYKELQLEGKDASKYDFKPEWIVYWNKKIVELHKIEVKVKIEALRKRLGLVDLTPVSFKIGGKPSKKHSGDTKLIPMAHPDNDHEVIVIDDKDDSMSPRRSHSPWETESVSKSRDRRLSFDRVSSPERDMDSSKQKSRDRYRRSPSWGRSKRDYRSRDREFRSRDKSWERDILYHRESRKDPKLDIYKPPSMMRDVTRKPVDYSRMNSPEDGEDGDVNIVAVLRLLTALEDKLGSLGPKIIDMLATALAMEKKDANSSEKLLDNEINCVLFETVKEKLKGALHAGLVDYNQEKAFKIAIKKIATLIHVAGNRMAEESKKNKPKVDPVKVPGVGTVDKAAIAKQIATALVLQGKTDVTHAELEQLINAVVGMAEASKNSDKPMTTASFLEQLSSTKPAETHPEIKLVSEPTPSTSNTENQSSKDSMEGLSDSDLQTLLQNFKDLSAEEQHGLITYLKKLESKEPDRVEKLRKFVNMGSEETPKESGRVSPFSRKLNDPDSHNPVADKDFSDFEDDDKSDVEEVVKVEKREDPKIEKIDSDDEEYSFEDVFKAASKNVEESKLVNERRIIEESLKLDSSKNNDADMLTDAKALIANIMGSIALKASPKVDPVVEKTLPSPTPTPAPPQPVINNQPVLQLNPPSIPQISVQNSPIKTNTINLNLNPGHSFPSQSGYGGPPRGTVPFNSNQNVQYPMKNQFGAPGPNPNYGNNYNYSNQFKQNNRFHPNRGQFGNVNNRGNGNFNNRW